MIKKLFVSEPVIKCFPKHANITSILSKHEYFYDWLFSNHIQLFCKLFKETDTYLDFYEPLHRLHYPLISRQSIDKKVIFGKKDNIISFLINCLELEYYIYLSVDTFYIPLYNSNIHRGHDIFVYGFDKNKKIFYVADFFGINYGYDIVDFQMFQQGVYSQYSDNNNLKGIQLLKVNQVGINSTYSLNITQIKSHLLDYINGINTSLKYSNLEEPNLFNGSVCKPDNRIDNYWGIGVYRNLHIAISQDHIPRTLIRSLHLLYEHKMLMTLRVNYLKNHDKSLSISINTFIELEKKCLILRNMVTKSMLKKRGDEKCLVLLNEIAHSDELLIQKLIDQL
mgnify:CR=1 FL=1